jgi:hypothetical protein
VLRVDGQDALVGGSGAVAIVQRGQDDAEIEVRTRMPRRLGQGLAVQRLGLRQAAGILAGVALGDQDVGGGDVAGRGIEDRLRLGRARCHGR